jgi:hypothetical protein
MICIETEAPEGCNKVIAGLGNVWTTPAQDMGGLPCNGSPQGEPPRLELFSG